MYVFLYPIVRLSLEKKKTMYGSSHWTAPSIGCHFIKRGMLNKFYFDTILFEIFQCSWVIPLWISCTINRYYHVIDRWFQFFFEEIQMTLYVCFMYWVKFLVNFWTTEDSCLEIVYRMYWLCYHIHAHKKTLVM